MSNMKKKSWWRISQQLPKPIRTSILLNFNLVLTCRNTLPSMSLIEGKICTLSMTTNSFYISLLSFSQIINLILLSSHITLSILLCLWSIYDFILFFQPFVFVTTLNFIISIKKFVYTFYFVHYVYFVFFVFLVSASLPNPQLK